MTKRKPKGEHLKTGRPSVISDEKLKVALNATRAGLGHRTISEILGVSTSTLSKWKREYPDFSQQITEARSHGKASVAVSLVNAARQGNVTAMIFYLKSRCPEFREERRTKKDRNAEREVHDFVETLARMRGAVPAISGDHDDSNGSTNGSNGKS
jgi:transposase-like protein